MVERRTCNAKVEGSSPFVSNGGNMQVREETRLVLWIAGVFLFLAIIALFIDNGLAKNRSHMCPAIEGGSRMA